MAGMKKVVLGIGLVLGVYLIGRAIAEFFVIDFSDSASYRADWGGPSLGGVLAIHCGFGLVALVLIVLGARRAIRRRSERRHRPDVG